MQLKWFAGTLLVAVPLTVTSTHRVLANVYDCDNDRDPNQYRNCFNSRIPSSNTSASGWSYRSGFSGDGNGDDRLSYNSNPSLAPEYVWNFSGLDNGNI